MEKIIVEATIRSPFIKTKSGGLTKVTDKWEVSYTRHNDNRIELHSVVPASLGRFDVLGGIDSWSKTGIQVAIMESLGMPSPNHTLTNLVNGNLDQIK